MKRMLSILWKHKVTLGLLVVLAVTIFTPLVEAATQYFFPTGRSNAYFIAASDATSVEKAQADLICDGTGDDVQIQQACTALTSGGLITLSSGTFNFTTAVTISNLEIKILGTNYSQITPTSCGAFIITASTHTTLEGLYIYGASAGNNIGIDAVSTDRFRLFNCKFDRWYIAYKNERSGGVPGYVNWIDKTEFTNSTICAVECSGSPEGFYLTNSYFYLNTVGVLYDTTGTVTHIITGNIFSGGANTCTYGIVTEDTKPLDAVIANNDFTDFATAGIDLQGGDNVRIIGNNFRMMRAGSVAMIRSYEIKKAVITGNTFGYTQAAENAPYVFSLRFGGHPIMTDSQFTNNYIIASLPLSASGQWVVNSQIRDNTNVNPRGLIANPIGTSFLGYGGSGTTVTTATAYVVSGIDCFITSTGGTVSNIVIKDSGGNTVLTGVTTLTNQFVPIGYSVTWTHTGAPTVTVYGN